MQLAAEEIQELRFTVVKGSNPGAKVGFEPGSRSIRIGRAVDNDIVIADASVSRSHARVEIRPEGCTIADLGSSSGLEKMGFTVGQAPEPLLSGDEFKLGDTILKFEVIAKKGALKRAEAREAGVAPKPSPIENIVGAFRRALATIGLRTPLLQAVGAACFAALIALGLWPEAPTIAPQSYAPLPIDYNAIHGTVSGEEYHADGALFEVPADSEGAGVYLRVLSGSGVEIRAGGRMVANVEAGGDWRSYAVIVLPRAIAESESPHLVVDHLGYSPADGPVAPDSVAGWGVARMWVVRVTDTASSPGRITSELAALKELYGQLEDDPANRFNLVKGLRTAIVGLMKLGGRPAVAYPIPFNATGNFENQVESAVTEIREGRLERALDRLVPALQVADVELTREYTRLANNLAVLKKRNAGGEIALIVPQILRLVPEPTDVRHRTALEASRTLTGSDLEAFQSAVKLP